MNDHFAWLQDWYLKQCNGEWEHEYGITISTLDNPGWKIEIDLEDTNLVDLAVLHTAEHRSESDWVAYEVSQHKFVGSSGPLGLYELLGVFRNYAQ